MRRPRKGFWVFFPLAVFAWFAPATVKADTYTVTGPQDWNFQLQNEVVFTARTYAWQYGIDSMIWLYDANNTIIAANDDYYGLDSNITVVLQPGSYRLRTGVCCGDPNRWYGTSYQLEVNASAVQTTTTSSTTTTEPATTTTTAEPTTSTTSTTTTSTVPQTTTTEGSTTTSSSVLPTESTISTTTTTSSTTTTTSPPPPPILQPLLPPDTTIETTTTTSTVPPSTTTTSVAETTTTLQATTTSVPPTTTDSPTTTAVSETLVPESIQEQTQDTTLDSGSVFVPLAPLAAASDEEKEQFESQVDIFSGDFDDYVPSGSTITVAQRRVIVGATVILFVVPLPVPAPMTPSTTSSASESTGRKEQD